ncbi:MAG: substrate-binding domain-containing protein [Candidatus Omnitrophica bacterium]|nr:substrate-binding domain-containing protein [Candidatus Omnitrophota bacterium]MBU1925428.1 substrate-binding domain-containing protein [Candidatus Omnitrophota bacterium]
METKIYTLIIPRFEDIFHSYFAQEVIKGASSSASRLKADLLIHITDRDTHDDWFSSVTLKSKLSDGILFADIDHDRTALYKIISRKIPYLVLNNYFEEPINCLAIDNYRATLKVIEYLVSLGHERIATICGDLNTEAGMERLKGYRDGLRAHKISVNERYIKNGDFLRTPARQAATQLFSVTPLPTAIFAASDVMALEAMDVAKQKGLKIPRQLSIVGFDDNPLNVYSSLGLTTVRQPISEMARLGLETLHRITSGKEKLPAKSRLTARLIKRESCASCQK